jgi:hypothetical protein
MIDIIEKVTLAVMVIFLTVVLILKDIEIKELKNQQYKVELKQQNK